MNAIPDLIPLHDSRPGVRTLLQVEVRDAVTHGESLDSSGPAATLDFIASTATLDRYHEVIEPAGWRLDAYRKNPVFQNAHNYGDILFTLGRALVTEVRAVGERSALCQRIEFATEVNPVARIAYGLYKGGFLNAVSVGFIPLRWEDGGSGSDAKGAPAPRRRYLEQELLEVDYKTQGVKRGNSARAYGSWCQQLAAYRRAIGQPMTCMNVIVNSTEPAAMVEHVWSEEELRAGWESFEAALVIWRHEKGYNPAAAPAGPGVNGAAPVLVA